MNCPRCNADCTVTQLNLPLKIKCSTEIELTLDQLALAFAGLDDDSQAQFFCKVAAIAETWTGIGASMQWYYVGKHLRDCECATEAGRDMLREIVEVMDRKNDVEF